ncbi:MAG: acetyl-CoA carboxylase carboxyl transferase subunit alpha, partial [Aquificota bacterium]
GRTTKEKMERNFGMPHPEGYRKAIRVARLAERYRMPVITLIDTPGAYPGIGAEERGQSEAIAQSLYTFGQLKVPTIAVIIGEGGSGGALALGVANRILMLENAVYSVISPEGCAAILWKDQSKVKEASRALKLTAQDLLKLGVIDAIVPEPLGAAHWDHRRSARILKRFLKRCLTELLNMEREELLQDRIGKFEKMGAFVEL